jgi:hypothetical protein
MRPIVLVAVALAGMSLSSTFADAGTWCGTFRLGSTSCGYSSSEECMATVRGLGGFCYPNPFPGTAYGTCPSRKSYPRVAMMQSGQDWCGDDGPRSLYGSS